MAQLVLDNGEVLTIASNNVVGGRGEVVTQAGGDVTAPVLSSPTGIKTGSTTGSGTVSTDEGNGTLYFTATENTSETAGTIKAASSQAVSGSGTQNVSFSGLTPSTTYYAHYVQDDAATNTSNVQSSSSFTTDAAGGLGVPIAAYHYNHNVGSNL